MMLRNVRILRWRHKRNRRAHNRRQWLLRFAAISTLLAFLFALFLLLATTLVATAVTTNLTRNLPQFADFVRQAERQREGPPTQIFGEQDRNRDGISEPVLIYEIRDPLSSESAWLPYDQIPQLAIDAVIAYADPDFWQERNFGEDGFVPALRLAFTSQDSAASLTRQIVQERLLQMAAPTTASERLRLLLSSQRATDIYTKEQLLSVYLNDSYFGNLAIGLEAAALLYFDKPAAALNLAEIAMLAALPQYPEQNPIDDFTGAKRLQTAVLQAMVAQQLISDDQARAASQLPVTVADPLANRTDVIAPHFALFVQHRLLARFGPEALLWGGYQVQTTLNLELQRQADCVMRTQLARLTTNSPFSLAADEQRNCAALTYLAAPAAGRPTIWTVDNASVLILEPASGEIKAMVGSPAYQNETIQGQINQATAVHPSGTLIHPFIYMTALSQGYSAATMLLDVETTFGNAAAGTLYRPQPQAAAYHGPLRLREALGNSLIVPATQMTTWVGPNHVLQTAANLGVTVPPTATLGLATNGVPASLLDLTTALATLSHNGQQVGIHLPTRNVLAPVVVRAVFAADAQPVYQLESPETQEIVSPQLAYLMNDLLSDRTARCAAFTCPNPMELPHSRPAAVFTGTTPQFTDGWTVGYTPELAIGVWVGSTDGRLQPGLAGSDSAAPIWQALMSWALADRPPTVWQRPAGLLEMAVCDPSGLLPTPHCPTVSELFIPNTQPTVPDNMYQSLAVNRETGRLATVDTPPDLIEQQLFQRLPATAASWAAANNIPQPPTEYDTLQPSNQVETAVISTPQPFATVQNIVEIRGTAGGDGFAGYRLAYFAGLTPTHLHTVAERSSQPVTDGVLGEWNVENLEGLYTLLLTVFTENGRFTEATIQVIVDNRPPQTPQ